MKRLFIIWFMLYYSQFSFAQDIPPVTEQQLENQTDANQAETEDDAYLQELEQFRKDPINLNTAGADELKRLKLLTDLQIASLLSYRNLLGKLISIYELQAVPAWDITSIRKLLPFVTLATPLSLAREAGKRFRNGDHSLLLRVAQVLEKAAGFTATTPGTKYAGSPQKIFFRYRYSYKNLLQFGLVGDKDAGEQFFKGAQNKGFDFYSFHFFARNIGIIKALALGDFSVNMGQGLIQWQSLAFKKSAETIGIKRQAPVICPYNSAGEFYFNRGVGITIQKGKISSTAFVSLRKLGANFVADTVNYEDFVSSFLSSGYHRTASENADRNNLTQASFGGTVIYRGKNWQAGINGIGYHFSLPMQKRAEPYNLYAISGKNWYNFSIDYNYTWKNFHFFGEAAVDKNLHKAFINGLLLSVDPRVDISFLQRAIGAAYQAVNGNAFTENTYPSNETGFYMGVSIRPINGWRLDAYADIYKFPWLKYLVDAPSQGKDFLVQLTFTPNKQAELYTRFRTETKQTNLPDNNTVTNYLVDIPKQSWRTQVNYKLNSTLEWRSRVELLWYDKKGPGRENGFLGFVDFIFKPLLTRYAATLRLQFFESSGYNSRVYAYENDVLFSYSIPALYNKGFRYYFIFDYDISKRISLWCRWAQTIYSDIDSTGSGTDEINGNKKSEIKFQARWIF